MAEQILSSITEAQKESNNLRSQASEINTSYSIARGATNLSIMDNIEKLATSLSEVCSNYQSLVNSHADSIDQLAQQFAEVDSQMSGEM